MLALYISLLDTEEQISKFEHIYPSIPNSRIQYSPTSVK